MRIVYHEKDPKNIQEKQAAAAIGQPILLEQYSRFFKRHGFNIAQLLLTRDGLENTDEKITH